MRKEGGKIIAWWSAGVTSAVACKLAIDAYGADNVRPIYFHIDSAHPDNERFKKQCEEWYGCEIEVWRSEKYKDQYDVIKQTRYINGAFGARCTKELKKEVRFKVEKEVDYRHQVFGFEYDRKEINRAIRFLEQYPEASAIFPLIEHKMTKQEALFYLEKAGIKRPVMYELGYANNNCIGCVKGGVGYWNKIRIDFPEHFERMSKLEEEIGATCLKDKNGRIPLRELDPNRGREQKIIMPDCGNFCDIEFTELEHEDLEDLYSNPKEITRFYFDSEVGV
jgi:3'-phosphoadenosine 5'-phosphosulfate sulfotransferase (PAPS reductase)/FAD synthetase